MKNECQPELRRDDLEDFCYRQELCMETDPYLVVTSMKVIIKFFVEMINNFIEPLSTKALGFLLISIFALIYSRGK